MMDMNYRAKILLSTHRALIGAIMPQMRRVDVCWSETQVFVRIVIDCPIDEELADEANAIDTEIGAAFWPVPVCILVETFPTGSRIPLYQPIEGPTECVFARKESENQ